MDNQNSTAGARGQWVKSVQGTESYCFWMMPNIKLIPSIGDFSRCRRSQPPMELPGRMNVGDQGMWRAGSSGLSGFLWVPLGQARLGLMSNCRRCHPPLPHPTLSLESPCSSCRSETFPVTSHQKTTSSRRPDVYFVAAVNFVPLQDKDPCDPTRTLATLKVVRPRR